jgi:EAL domain
VPSNQRPDDADDFLSIAERSGAILDIGRWVLCQACADAVRWSNDIRVSVNASSLQLESTEFVHDVKAALARAKLDPSMLQLEIGEQLFDRRSSGRSRSCTSCASRHQRRARRFRQGGLARQSAGLSLRRGQDRPEAHQGLTQPRGQRGDRTVGRHARAGLVDAQRRQRRRDGRNVAARVGCRRMQGFYFSRPVPASQLGTVLSECQQKLAVAA